MTAIVQLLGGWRATAFAALLCVVLVFALVWRSNAAVARLQASKAQAQAKESSEALKAAREAASRDDKSAEATNTARNDMQTSAAGTQARIAKQEVKTRDRSPVPIVCPEPDADLVREHVKGSAEVRAAEGRLRGIRSAEGSVAK